MHPACDLGLSGHKPLSFCYFIFLCVLRRLEDFVIYMPCIKLSTVITISIYWTTVLDRCHRSNVV